MKQLSYYLLFIIAVSVMVACSSEDDIFTDGYIANNGGSSGTKLQFIWHNGKH